MRLDQKKRFEIQTLMASVLDTNGEYVAYKDGWSDEAIGKKFNVPPSVIAGTRTTTFGKLRKNRINIAALTALTDRVERLERVIADLTGVEIIEQKKNGEDVHAA